ncbi:MAG: DUF3536 domain-containing protein [Candidatus Krumholzibacteriota bacterium]|nr:DUF3536 domain-containing protein [Candidatus Krumholzibacteriota bacterium]
MDETGKKRHLIIHGHFYQPPRENPWTQRIDRQESASPYHDWNERISRECYRPNARSRRLDGYGRVTRLVNNYEAISFNFGPTLLSWIEDKDPALIDQLAEADRASARRLGGKGNAVAQVYNHIIMPLANIQDQKTQIRWGVSDFEKRFERSPEGIWLAETAINDLSLGLLIDFGFRFAILSPFQAEKFRPLGKSGGWKTVDDGSIPTGRAYRSYTRTGKGKRRTDRFIDIFFYDARLSTDISFNHLLSNGDRLAEAISDSFERCGGDLVTIATDGEIYGHHEPFGDMALAYLIDEGARRYDISLTNFSAYLDSHETQFEVVLKAGKNGEGTAWSCSHGVGRWKEDCGCSTGGLPGWNQKWRTPLREGLDTLRDRLSAIFEKKGALLLTDPWQARDDYISVMTPRSVEKVSSFIREKSRVDLSDEDLSLACRLLEAQRNALLMFTSCGWFFNDISGIETVQLLKYAARAIELGGCEDAADIENEFLLALEKARSNTAPAGTGRDLYLEAKSSSSVRPSFLAGQYVLASSLSSTEASPEIFGYNFNISDDTVMEVSGITLNIGRVSMTSPYTLEKNDFKYILVVGTPARVACMLNECAGSEEFESMKSHFSALPADTDYFDIVADMADYFEGNIFVMRDLFSEDREKILGLLAKKQILEVKSIFEKLYFENREILRLFKETSLTPPESLLAPARAVLAERLSGEIDRWTESFDTAGLDGIKKVISESNYYGIELDKSRTLKIFTGFFLGMLSPMRESLSNKISDQLFTFAEYCREIDLELPHHDIQNEIFTILETRVGDAADRIATGAAGSGADLSDVVSFLRLAERFNFNIDSWQERLPK